MIINLKSFSILILVEIALIFVNLEILGNAEQNNNYVYSNDKNWFLLRKAFLSNKIFEYPPSYYFKFKENNIVYTIYYDFTLNKVTRRIFEGFWKIDQKEKSIILKIKDVSGKNFLIDEKYFSFKIYINNKSGQFDDVIILYKKKIFKEPEDENGYYGLDYFILSVVQKIPEESDIEYLKKL